MTDRLAQLAARRPTSTAADIAADLAVAIGMGYFPASDKTPSQNRLMETYKVAAGTANAATAKLIAVGLAFAKPGSGTFVADIWHAYPDYWGGNHPVVDVFTASRICRSMAATSFLPDDNPTTSFGGHPFYDDPHLYDPEKHSPPKRVSVRTLVGLDRHLLRWMSEAFLDAARRMVGAGEVADTDRHLVEAARSILRDGGTRPDNQAPIAEIGGPVPDGEDVVLRIWPERAREPGPNDPPF